MSSQIWIYFKNQEEKELEFEQFQWKNAVETALEYVKKDDVKSVQISGEGAAIWDFFGRGFFLDKELNEKTGKIEIRLVSKSYNIKGKYDEDLLYGIFGEKKIKKKLLKEGKRFLY